MPAPPDVPAFSGPRAEILGLTMEWVHENVRRSLPDPTWIRERFLRRTIAEVVTDGFTLAYAPCVDRSLVTAAILGEHGIEMYVVLHDAPNGTWHLIMEVPLEDGSWLWGDYGTHESRLYPGRYRYGQLEDRIPRLLRMKGPKPGPRAWDSRPPLRFLAGMGVDLGGRFGRFTGELQGYRDSVDTEAFSLTDTLIRNPDDSIYAEVWRTRKVVAVGDPEVNCVDLSPIHLYLERPR